MPAPGIPSRAAIGSGDVNNRANVSLYEGLQEAGVALTSEDWITDYEHRYTAARLAWKDKILDDATKVENPFDAYAANPFVLPQGRPVTLQDLIGASAAIYVISRISGEGKDRTPTAGDYLLSDREMADLRTLNEAGLPLVLVLNAGGPVELTDLLAEYRHSLAVLQISQPGQQGGEAVADILLARPYRRASSPPPGPNATPTTPAPIPSGPATATWKRKTTPRASMWATAGLTALASSPSSASATGFPTPPFPPPSRPCAPAITGWRWT